jgi:hypothetical protein
MNRISSVRVILAVAMALIGVTCIARADDDERTCSVAALRGSYLFAASGYNIVGGVAQPKAVVEVIRFDGNGSLTVPAVTVSVNGAIVHPPPNGTGTYTVAPDCSGTLLFAMGTAFDLFLAPGAREFTMIQTNPLTVLQGKVVKLAR